MNERLRLRGHTAPVAALAASTAGDGTLASAAQDGAVRIWDVAAGACVRCVAIASQLSDDSNDSNDSNDCGAVAFAAADRSDLVLVAASRSLVLVDMRSHAARSSVLFTADDDINAIGVHGSLAINNDSHDNYSCDVSGVVAAADDSGRIHLVDTAARRPLRRLRSTHTCIASAAAFRPRRQWELWSGGFDHAVMRWDAASGALAASIDMRSTPIASSTTTTDASTSNPLPSVNPPFVLSFAFDASGLAAAAGLGDGSICFLQWRPPQKQASARRRHGRNSSNKRSSASSGPESITRIDGLHRWSVSALEFAPTSTHLNSPSHDHHHQHTLVSGALDGTIGVWSLNPLQDNHSPSPTLITSTSTPRKINAISVLSTATHHASHSSADTLSLLDHQPNFLVASAGTALQNVQSDLDAFSIIVHAFDSS